MSTALAALWRVLISAVALSYLVCVLFLSGLQKEDLDVSMLTKLHRYNVNVDDINNEQLRKNCIGQDSTSLVSDDTMDSHTLKYPYEVSDLKNLKNAEYSKHEEVKFRDSTKPQTDDNINFIKYHKGQPDIESVMKFWNNYKKIGDTGARTTETHKISTRRAKEALKTELPNKVHFSVDFNETEFINKLLWNHYKSQSKNEPTQIPITPSKSVYEEDYNLDAFKTNNNNQPVFSDDYIKLPIRQLPLTEPILEFKTIEKNQHDVLESKLPTEHKLDDILKTINQFKAMFSNMNPLNGQKSNDQVVKHSPDSYSKITQEKISGDVNGQTKPVVLQPTFTEDLVYKIAKNVKEMVLHDLRKEMQVIMTTTQKVELKSTSHKYTSEDNIMNKVMNMLQALKIQQTPMKITVKDLKSSNPEQTYKENSGNKNYYDLPSKQVEFIMNTQQPYVFAPQIHKFKTNSPNYKQQKIMSRPITFQTNALEIPPLGIPITHQQNPINQNIIVTTATPFKMHYESDNGPSYSDSALMKVYPKEIIKSPLSAKFSKRSDDCPLNHPCNHKNEDIIRFRLSNDGKAKYDTDYYEKINLPRIQPRLNNNHEKFLGNTQRFHEKLERPDDRYQVFGDINNDCCNSKLATQQMVDCCNEKIASRQQMSIAKMKRGSYDDTHFRNFLKTQQKVTDMLEKILASKNRSDLPRSVETT